MQPTRRPAHKRLQYGTLQPGQHTPDLCFFFSSRRRHTRFDCDWSSDVCSSDLSNSLRGPIALGFAAGATDTGHEGGSGRFALDANGRLDWQAIQDNAYLGIHEIDRKSVV